MSTYSEIVPLDNLATDLDARGFLNSDSDEATTPEVASARLDAAVSQLVEDRADQRTLASTTTDTQDELVRDKVHYSFDELVGGVLLAALAPVSYSSQGASFTAEGVNWTITSPRLDSGNSDAHKRGWHIVGTWVGQEEYDGNDNLLYGPQLERSSTKDAPGEYVFDSSAGDRLPALIVAALAQAREQRAEFERRRDQHEARRRAARDEPHFLGRVDPFTAGVPLEITLLNAGGSLSSWGATFYAQSLGTVAKGNALAYRRPNGRTEAMPVSRISVRVLSTNEWDSVQPQPSQAATER